MKILVADDDPINRKRLHALLSHKGHTVIECAHGLAALACLEQSPCDSVISEVLMPHMDGFRLCYEIRRNKNLKNIPLILYTATQLSATDEKAVLAMGADRFVRQPAQPEQIIEALDSAVETCHTRTVMSSEMSGDLSALREYSEVLVRKLEDANVELSVANAMLAENERRLRAIIESEPECVKILARDGTLLEMNPAGLRMIEADSAARVIGKKIDGLIVPDHRGAFRQLTEAAFRGESGTLQFEILGFKETRRWFDTHVVPLRNSKNQIVAALGITRDITEQKHNAALLSGQMRVLEMIGQGAPLVATLDVLLRVIEDQCNDMLCSILLLDPEGRHLKHGAAPRLPSRYTQAVDGAAIGETAGSCGTAVYRREQVIVEDIAADPLWGDWREIALAHGLRACCSTPIFDARQRVLGSLAVYFRTARRPTEVHSRLINVATHIAAIAISKQREEDALRESEARFREMADSAPVMIWMTGPDGACNYVNKQWLDFTAQAEEAAFGLGWLDAIHPADQELVGKNFFDAAQRHVSIRLEYRLQRSDGEYRWVIDSAQPRVSERGEFLGYIGSVFDISERKQAEDQRQQSLQRVRALHEINLAITSTMNRRTQLEALLENIERFFAYPIVSTFRLFRPETGRLESIAGRGLDEQSWREREQNRPRYRALRVVETKAPLVVADIRQDETDRNQRVPANPGLVSYAGVPLITRDEAIGVLGVYTKSRHEFTVEEIDFLATVAGQAAVALENARLYEQSERRRREAEALARVAHSLAETLDIRKVGERVVASVMELFNVKGATLRLRQPDGSLTRLTAAGEVFSQLPSGAVLPAGIGVATRAFAAGKPIWSADILNDPAVCLSPTMRDYLTYTDNGSLIAVPLRAHENTLGVLTLADRTGRGYVDYEIDLLRAFADQVALALQNARLYERTERDLKRIEALRDIETALTSTLDLQAVLHVLMEKIMILLPFSAATTIRLLNRTTGVLENRACLNIDEGQWKARVGRGNRSRSNEILRTKRPVIVANMQDEPGVSAAAFYREYGFVSYLGVPLIVKDEVQGILGFYTKEAHDFNQDEVDLLLTVAGQAATAISNARLYDDINLAKNELEISNRSLDRSLKQLDSLYNTLAPLTPGASNQEIMDAIIGRLIEATGADASLIRIWDSETKNYRIINQSGYPKAFLERVGDAPRSGAVDWVVQHGEPILAPDIAVDERFQGKAQLAHGFRSSAMLPLSTQDDVRGVMQLSSRRLGHFDKEHKDHLMAIARQISTAMENRRLFNDLQFSRDKIARANAALTESNRMLTALHAVASASSQSLNLEQILRAAIEKMTEIFNFDATRIHLYDEKHEALTLRASFEQDPVHFAPARVFQRGKGVVGAVAGSGEKMIFTDAPNDPRYRAFTSKTTNAKHSHRFLAVFPIKGKDTSVGTITCVSDAPRSLGSAEIQLLEAIADQLAVAIENSRLYEDVRAKVDELQIKTIELERANKVKDEFLGVVSHELRTPINVIMGYTSLFKDGVLGNLKHRQEEALAKITWETKELLAMINTLLYATTLETEKATIETQEFSPETLLEELRANYAVTVPGRVTMEWRYPAGLPELNTDRRKLKQVLDNLIGNAVKFTEQGRIVIAARPSHIADHGKNNTSAKPASRESPSRPSALEFTVTDTGVGMPADKLNKIFEKFYQVDSSGTRRFGGVGLGLYIAKHFTDLLGGRLSVSSAEGAGSTFTLTVPLAVTTKNIVPPT